MARLREQGAVGDILGNYVDVGGRLIASPHRGRLIALSIDDLHRVGTVVAVASEAEKPAAILGVLRAGVVDVLVVDEDNAHVVLDLARAQQPDESQPARALVSQPGEVIGRTVSAA
jgi:DNA-binding transcriptional regulator LsrR (DeoR family)